MISIWEGLQGLLFMAVFGGITRGACRERLSKPSSAPQTAAQAAVLLPVPRVAPEEEYGSLPVG